MLNYWPQVPTLIYDDDNDSDIKHHILETQETNDLDIAWI